MQKLGELDSQGLTYLGFLLETVRPRVEERLQEYPDSDPILEVATSVLLELFPDYWTEVEAPLSDEWSPQSSTPPPPPPGTGATPPAAPPAPEEGEDSEFDEGESPEPDDEDDQNDEDDRNDAGDGEEVAADVEIDIVEDVQDIDDLGASEEQSVDTRPPAGFVSAIDDTTEFAPPPIRRKEEKESIWPLALDDPTILHGARILLAVLLDNDRLPQGEQLMPAEMVMASDLWVHLVVQDTDLDERVQKLARLVEQKFGANCFSQARLLLQLFPANTETRVNNDRQLFYEDMIYRLGIRRSHSIGGAECQDLVESLSDVDLGDDDSVRKALTDLEESTGLGMHVYTREPGEVDQWRQLVEKCELPGVEPYVLGMIPPRRWRPIKPSGERTVQTVLREHIVRPMARDYVIGHIKTCYFILRAVGDTGLEPYLDSFFDWSKSCCQINATTFLPELHQQMTHSSEMINQLFGDIYDQCYREAVDEELEALDDAALTAAFGTALEQMAAAELGEIAPGNFDLGAFVLDAYLEFEQPTPAFAFKIYRLT